MGAPLYGGGGLNEALRVDAWLHSVLSSSAALTTAAPGGVWRGVAPNTVPSSSIYVVYSVQASPDAAGVAGWRIKTTCVCQVAAVGPTDAALAIGQAGDVIDQLLQRVGPLTFTSVLGNIQILACVRQSALLLDELDSNGVQYTKSGGLYRIGAKAA